MLCGIFSAISLQVIGGVLELNVSSIRSLFILVAICCSGTAFAQGTPKAGNKALVQAEPKAPIGCKFVGTVRGTKLWAGDCVGSELRGLIPTTEPQAAPKQPTGAITPDQKE